MRGQKLRQTPIDNPGQWIRQWKKFSQGLADRPAIYAGPVFEYQGQSWAGMPVELFRLLPGYHQVGDTVLCYGHVPSSLSTSFRMDYRQVQRVTAEEWLAYEARDRRDWTTALEPGLVSRICHIGIADSVSARIADPPGHHWNISRTCLALPVDVHRQRCQELQEQHRWVEWQDHPNIFVRCISGQDREFHMVIEHVLRRA